MLDLSLARQYTAPATGVVGSFFWYILGKASDVNFLLSFEDQRAAHVFQFIMEYGWMVLLLSCLLWAALIRWGVSSVPTPWSLAVMTSIVFFGLGAITAANFAERDLEIVESWGVTIGSCTAVIDTSRLSNFSAEYNLVLGCGPSDPEVDVWTDSRAVMSRPFTIKAPEISILATWTEKQKQELAGYLSIWVRVGLVPNKVDVSTLKNLTDIEAVGGKVGGGGPRDNPLRSPVTGGFTSARPRELKPQAD